MVQGNEKAGKHLGMRCFCVQPPQAADQLAWADVLHRFQFTERLQQGVMIPAEPREEYYPVYYQEPLVEGGIAVGFDLGSHPTRLEALSHARDTGAVQAIAGKGELVIPGRRNGAQDMIAIQDNGPGIPAETRTRIFEPLFSTKAKGTGLGLTICRQIVAKHGGTIDLVDSTHGAVFRIVLPRYDDGQEA